MKKLLIILLIGLTNCGPSEGLSKRQLSRFLETYGIVTLINPKQGTFTVTWQCLHPAYKNQPCFATSEHLVKQFPEIELLDTLRMELHKKPSLYYY